MAFVKEKIPESDKDLFNSFDVYDYDNKMEHTRWSPDSKWVADRKREIYFFYVSGGHHLEQHPYQQYDLIWKGRKVVIFLHKWGNYDPKIDGSLCSCYSYDIVDIHAPTEFKKYEHKLISLIKEAIKADHATIINNFGVRDNPSKIQIRGVFTPKYYDDVR